jgi:hypothetical protein
MLYAVNRLNWAMPSWSVLELKDNITKKCDSQL